MSTGGPDLFVICKNCGSEVSPYITECPYCGNRLRKRAPKLDRDGQVAQKRRRRSPKPSLTPLRSGEIPGIAADSRPYATIVLVLLGLVGCLLARTTLLAQDQLAIVGKPDSQWWRLFSAPFTYDHTGYAFVALAAVGLYGWLMERRHGSGVVIGLFLLGGVGGVAATTALYSHPFVLGASGGALALLCAWVVPDVLRWRMGEEIEGDLIGTAAIAVVVALMPLAVEDASWVADGVGVVAGLAIGLPLARVRRR
ncbi:MAG: rhomboid family intramembrane serine protease [Solirubrobacteraceae bacterium]